MLRPRRDASLHIAADRTPNRRARPELVPRLGRHLRTTARMSSVAATDTCTQAGTKHSSARPRTCPWSAPARRMTRLRPCQLEKLHPTPAAPPGATRGQAPLSRPSEALSPTTRPVRQQRRGRGHPWPRQSLLSRCGCPGAPWRSSARGSKKSCLTPCKEDTTFGALLLDRSLLGQHSYSPCNGTERTSTCREGERGNLRSCFLTAF